VEEALAICMVELQEDPSQRKGKNVPVEPRYGMVGILSGQKLIISKSGLSFVKVKIYLSH